MIMDKPMGLLFLASGDACNIIGVTLHRYVRAVDLTDVSLVFSLRQF